MHARDLRHVLLVVLCGSACGSTRAASQTTRPVTSAPAARHIHWQVVESHVATELCTADLVSLAMELAAAPDGGDAAELFRRLQVLVRAGFWSRAEATIDALRNVRWQNRLEPRGRPESSAPNTILVTSANSCSTTARSTSRGVGLKPCPNAAASGS